MINLSSCNYCDNPASVMCSCLQGTVYCEDHILKHLQIKTVEHNTTEFNHNLSPEHIFELIALKSELENKQRDKIQEILNEFNIKVKRLTNKMNLIQEKAEEKIEKIIKENTEKLEEIQLILERKGIPSMLYQNRIKELLETLQYNFIQKIHTIWASYENLKDIELTHILNIEEENISIKKFEFSECGEYIISTGISKTTSIWDWKSGSFLRNEQKEQAEIPLLNEWSQFTKLQMEGERLIINSEPPKLELPNEEPPNPPKGEFSKERKYLALWFPSSRLNLINLQLGAIEYIFIEHYTVIACAVFSYYSELLAVGYKNGNICIWKTKNGKLSTKLIGHKKGVECLAFSMDIKLLVSGSFDRTIRI